MKLLLATAWILLGGAMAGGVYWTFLITPVSTAFALAFTAILAVIVLALIGFIANGAMEIWTNGWSLRGIMRAFRSIPAIVPAALIVLVLWWLTSRSELWLAERSGPINAWFIARFGWDDMRWLFTAFGYLANWLRWVVGLMLALSLMAAIVSLGWSGAAKGSWITAALRPRKLFIATAALVILVALPWMFIVPWRPESLPPTSLETIFIVTKLTLVAVAVAIGLAVVLKQVAPASPVSPASPASSASPVSPAL